MSGRALPAVQSTLTDEEEKLLTGIELDALRIKGYEHAQKNADAVCELMRSLTGREAIPEIRARFFADGAYNAAGRGRSIQDIFEQNGSSTREQIFRHPHFLKHLRYFIYGPHLPEEAMEAFRAEVESCGPVTSGDVVPLTKCARRLTREHRLEAHDAADEFYKLALECGLGLSYASAVREYVRKTR